MDLRKVRQLIELAESKGLIELEVRHGEETIRIVRSASTPAVAPQPSSDAGPKRAAASSARNSGFVVKAPLAGTFYRAPAPGERPFVTPGQTVAVGDVLCIIESMKMMNQIEAERAGTVREVLIEDGRAIGAGEPLFTFE
jgi:acetyl-CoA carboxylase biotin carboxyl carrier protein